MRSSHFCTTHLLNAALANNSTKSIGESQSVANRPRVATPARMLQELHELAPSRHSKHLTGGRRLWSGFRSPQWMYTFFLYVRCRSSAVCFYGFVDFLGHLRLVGRSVWTRALGNFSHFLFSKCNLIRFCFLLILSVVFVMFSIWVVVDFQLLFHIIFISASFYNAEVLLLSDYSNCKTRNGFRFSCILLL